MKVRKAGSKRNAHGTQKPANILVAKRERKKQRETGRRCVRFKCILWNENVNLIQLSERMFH